MTWTIFLLISSWVAGITGMSSSANLETFVFKISPEITAHE
jgi:hypothetical protein